MNDYTSGQEMGVWNWFKIDLKAIELKKNRKIRRLFLEDVTILVWFKFV